MRDSQIGGFAYCCGNGFETDPDDRYNMDSYTMYEVAYLATYE